MASILTIDGKWRAQINSRGVRRSRTFKTKAEATRWAKEFEEEFLAKGIPPSEITFDQLLTEYARKVTPHKRGASAELRRIIALSKEPTFQNLKLSDINKRILQEWIDDKIGSISHVSGRPLKSSTVARYFTVLKAIFNKAVEWEYIEKSPAIGVRCKVVEDHRERVATDEEIEKLKICALWNESEPPRRIMQRVIAAFVFACFTGMRIGEIVAMERSWISGCVINIPRESTKTFHGRSLAVPLRAQQILQQVFKLNLKPKIFGLEPQQHDAIFREIRNMAGLGPVFDSRGHCIKEGLNFHDSRATFCTWAASPGPDGAPRLDVMSLARQTGHRNLRFLMHYYRKRPEEMLDRLNS